ncbi:MAG: hypothetical protein CM15mP78_10320 [Candidatus Poseidoniales archaeon]|nr:MAG: hypothetical protein CM15mP78_10320 [Candidatus Poseidoniales archaeon]
MSGTTEEANTSAYICSIRSDGAVRHEHSYQVPMHHVNAEPSLRICIQGLGGNSPVRRLWRLGQSNHPVPTPVDYVIQGSRDASEYTFNDDVPVTDVGNRHRRRPLGLGGGQHRLRAKRCGRGRQHGHLLEGR